MKIAHLISRFEKDGANRHLVNDEDCQQHGEETNIEENGRKRKPRPRSASPGQMALRKAFQTLRSPGKNREKALDIEKELNKEEFPEKEQTTPLSVEARVDNVLKSITSHRNSFDRQKHQKDTRGGQGVETNEDGHDNSSRREFLITEHSNRTLVIDNKKNKSQNSALPDTPWSNRNFVGSPKRISSKHIDSTIDYKPSESHTEDNYMKEHHYESEYGTLALKGDVETKASDRSLAPEVVAMAAATEKNSKSRSSSLPSLRKRLSTDRTSKNEKNKKNIVKSESTEKNSSAKSPRRPRHPSPGMLGRRKNIPAHPTDSDKGGDVESEKENSDKQKKPSRSYSAGQINTSRFKLRVDRSKERKARSQSPSKEPKKMRPRRKKSDKNFNSKNAMQNEIVISIDDENSGQKAGLSENLDSSPASPRRTRGRSPRHLKGKANGANEGNANKISEEKTLSAPGLRRLPSRGRSPGTIRQSINMSGEITRDHSLYQNEQLEPKIKNPGVMRKSSISVRPRSTGALRNFDKASGHSEGKYISSPKSPRLKGSKGIEQSPLANESTPHIDTDATNSHSKGGEIVFRPRPLRPRSPGRLSGTEVSFPKSSSSPNTGTTQATASPAIPSHDITVNLSVPRNRSPGALARRPAKNLRTTQTRKAQSLFVKKSSPWTNVNNPAGADGTGRSNDANPGPGPVVSPRRKSGEDVGQSVDRLLFEKSESSPTRVDHKDIVVIPPGQPTEEPALAVKGLEVDNEVSCQ